MAAKLEKTRTPGIYRRGGRYVFSYRVDGKQRWESCRTIDEARRLKAARATDIERGEFEPRSRVTLHEYAREWVERYQGRGRRGFREGTRADYRRQIEQYICRYFPARCVSRRSRRRRSPGSLLGYAMSRHRNDCSLTRPCATSWRRFEPV